MRFVDFPRFQITLNFFQFFHVLSIFFPVKINPSSPAVLAPYLPPTLTNIPIKPLVLFDTWNPNDPCFEWKRPCFVGLTFTNRGHQRVPGIYIYTYVPEMHPLVSGIFSCLPPMVASLRASTSSDLAFCRASKFCMVKSQPGDDEEISVSSRGFSGGFF